MPLPQLRYVDIAPINHRGENVICLRDPAGYIEDPLILSPVAFFIASHLNGENEVADIQYAFSKFTNGLLLRSEDVHRVVDFLDNQGFLLTENFTRLQAEVECAFAAQSVRPAYLAGKSYPADQAALRAYLDSMFLREDGPGRLPGQPGSRKDHLRALVVPHIDYERGGASYAHGYLRLHQGARPDTVIVFGVAHASPPAPFVLTRKHFETPIATVQTDTDMVDQIASACPRDPFEYEIAHRTEHSIELQAVMLAYLFGSDVKIAPILCGSFASDEEACMDPAERPDIVAFLEACRAAANEPGKRVAVVAGADLAHVGKRFGDDFDIDDQVVRSVRSRDEEDLAHAQSVDAARWYASVMRDANARRVCGINCIYAALKTVEGSVDAGDVIHYDYEPDPAGGIVSFGTIVYPTRH